MSKVVELIQRNKPESEVWQCQCGHFGFWLYSTGQVVCQDCETEAESMLGFWKIPAKPAATTHEPNGNKIRQLFPSSES